MRLRKDFILWRFDFEDEVEEVLVLDSADDDDVEAVRVVDEEADDICFAVGGSRMEESMLLRLESTFMSMSYVLVALDAIVIVLRCEVDFDGGAKKRGSKDNLICPQNKMDRR
jgi:hypothetical protein